MAHLWNICPKSSTDTKNKTTRPMAQTHRAGSQWTHSPVWHAKRDKNQLTPKSVLETIASHSPVWHAKRDKNQLTPKSVLETIASHSARMAAKHKKSANFTGVSKLVSLSRKISMEKGWKRYGKGMEKVQA